MTSSVIRPACITKYLGPTDSRGGRVQAKHCTTNKRTTLAWDHALDVADNHELAAAAALGVSADNLARCSVDSGGYVFMVRK